jgi:hypothetical protein
MNKWRVRKNGRTKKEREATGEGKIKRLQPFLIKIYSAHLLEISGHIPRRKQPTNQTRAASMT